MTRRPSDVRRGALLRPGGLSERVYAVTRWREQPPGVVAIDKHDVTDDFLAIARSHPRCLGVVPELADYLPSW